MLMYGSNRYTGVVHVYVCPGIGTGDTSAVPSYSGVLFFILPQLKVHSCVNFSLATVLLCIGFVVYNFNIIVAPYNVVV